jgi:hypothetical protein
MKKQTTVRPSFKLKLNRETLRQLEEEDAKQVHGGSLNPCHSGNPPCPFT